MTTCPDVQASFLNLFDLSVAPRLLFYSYLPTIFIALFLSFLVIRHARDNRAKFFFSLSIFFALWVLNTIVQWVGVYAEVVMFSWQLNSFLLFPLFLLSVCFVYVYLNDNKLPGYLQATMVALYLPVLIALPTKLNISSFDLTNCEGKLGSIWLYIYALEFIFIVYIIYLFINKLRNTTSEYRKQFSVMFAGILFFLIGSWLFDVIGEYTQRYEITLVGPLGMVLFLGAMSYLIVRFHAFNIRLIAAQALIYSLTILIASQFFFIQSFTNQIITAGTLLTAIVLGYFLVLGVKHEIEQKEENERLVHDLSHTSDRLLVVNENLNNANERLKEFDRQKTEFVSIASHQLRSPLTAIKGYSSMLLDGSFGKINVKATDAISRIFESSQRLVNVIEDFLNITRIELGKMKYEMADVNLGDLVETISRDLSSGIEKKGIKLVYKKPEGKHFVVADSGKIGQVVGNLIDNASKYTPKGTITVTVEKMGEVERVSVCDTGMGINKETIPQLFEKFVRADEAGKVNIKGTGLGLYVAKQIIEGHNGKIWAESEGPGKGSCFYIELKAK